MASSKRERASMREGPLSELFRRTEKNASTAPEPDESPSAEAPQAAPPAQSLSLIHISEPTRPY